MSYTNADGLRVVTDADQGTARDQGVTTVNAVKTLVLEIPDATAIPSSAAAPIADAPFIPAGSYIRSASLLVETAFTSGGSATLTIGTQTAAGAAIDADGIDATVAVAALGANAAVACNGAQVGGAVTVGAADAYLSFLYGTAAFTAGKAKVVIEYIEA